MFTGIIEEVAIGRKLMTQSRQRGNLHLTIKSQIDRRAHKLIKV